MSNRLEISLDVLELQENGSYRKRTAQPIAAKPVTARGQLKPRTKNKTETRFEEEFLKPRLHTREILWYDYECWSFRIGDDCRYYPDYPTLLADGELVIYEVKGAKAIFQDDAKVKMRACAERYPMRFILALPVKGGGWEFEQVK
jgi:hypothetical protein